MKNTLPFIAMLAALAGLNPFAAEGSTLVVDQSQTVGPETVDISTSGNSGQSFTAGISGSLTAIRLVVEGKGYSGSNVFGSDFVLSLWSTAPAGTPTRTLLATGTFARSTLQRNIAQWVTITLDVPYDQTAGEVLAFTIDEATAGADGFNGYGSVSGNPYSAGQMFFGFTAGQPLAPSTRDIAFETIVAVPEPNTIALLVFGSTALLVARRRRPGPR